MQSRWTGPAVLVCLASVSIVSAAALERAPTAQSSEETSSTMQRAEGTFEVKLEARAPDEGAAQDGVGRMSIDKRFQGDLEGTSTGQMLAYRTATEGSAGYVAMERVEGRLGERSGGFALQHSGTMTRGAAQQSVTIVPDSGTGGLDGIAGSMTIRIDAAGHHYELEYTLPDGG